MITDNRNLEKSFEKLKDQLFEAQRRAQKGKGSDYAGAFGFLKASVQVHLIQCTGTSFDELHSMEREEAAQLPVPSNTNTDDIPNSLFNRFDNEGEE